jgi:hypothetical protein
MIEDFKVIVFFTIQNHKYAKIVIPQLLSQNCVDSFVLINYSNDPYVNGFLQTVLSENNKVEILKANTAKTIDQSILECLRSKQVDDNDICIYFGEQTCFIAPNCVEELALFTIKNTEYEIVYPAGINTEKTTYIHQTTNQIPQKLLWRWDTDYLDNYSFANTKADFHVEIHETFLEKAETEGLDNFKFNYYKLSKIEIRPRHAFAMTGTNFVAHFKSKSTFFHSNPTHVDSAICGKALCSWFANKNHLSHLSSTDLLDKYADFGQKIYSTKITPLQTFEKYDDISNLDTGLFPGVMFNHDKDGSFKIKFAISSHVSIQHKTLPVLLKSLEEANIPPEDILVVVGGAARQDIKRNHGILYSYVTHNSFDHNPHIDILEKGWGGDWWFIMHDTTKAGPNFKEKLLKFGPRAEHVAALKDGWLNIGLFSKKSLNEMSDYILKLKDCNKMQAILSEQLYARMTDYAFYDRVDQMNFPYYGDVYGDNVQRQVMYFETIDLYKFQSFHFYADVTKKVIDEWVMK